MAGLIASGQSVACNFQKQDASGSQSGTVYVAQNKMRGEFNVSDPSSGNFLMHMINDGEYSYSWGGPFGENQGMKMKASAGQGASRRQGPDLQEEMEFDCQPWTADAVQFTIPSNVQFMEMGGTPGIPDMRQLQCAACDGMTEGPERQQCQQALGCS